MQRRRVLALALVMTATILVARIALAFEVQATIKRVDAEARRITFFAKGQDRSGRVAEDAKLVDTEGKPLADGLKSASLKPGAEVTLSVERGDDGPVVHAIRLGSTPGALAGDVVKTKKKKAAAKKPEGPPPPKVDMTGVKPLIDMGPDDRYHGYPGGLYPNVQNKRPQAHEIAGLALAKQVQPLDRDGKPTADGKIVLLSIGFSNTSQCFTGFMQVAKNDPAIDPHVVLVNGAVGGMPASAAQDPEGAMGGRKYWPIVAQRIEEAGVTPAQVQVVWIKETDPGPQGGFPTYAKTLEGEVTKIVQLLPGKYPNLKLAYLSSRTWSGWSLRPQANYEPDSYETGFAVKWLIERQIEGEPGLNFDPAKGPVKAPWLSWGPYWWANGETPRAADGFHFEHADYTDNDQMHHSQAGIQKRGKQLLDFFKTDTTTRTWFNKPGAGAGASQ